MADTIELITATGDVYDLSEGTDGVIAVSGISGRYLPPTQQVEEQVALQPGARLRYAQDKTREISLNLLMRDTTAAGLRALMRLWVNRFHHLKGDAKLRFTSPVGDEREITVRYEGGFEVPETKSTNPIGTWQTMIVTFRAVDPYFTDITDTSTVYSGGTPRLFFPIMPLWLSADSVSVTANINNDGDIETWPVWEITGPGTSIRIRNLTTNKSIFLEGLNVLAGEKITIDTRPGKKTVLDNAGNNKFSSLSAESKLFSLEPGINQVNIEVGGTISISQVALNYRRRWLSV